MPCTGCRYCTAGCPVGLDIPYLLECYNSFKTDAATTASMRVDGLTEAKRPAACVGCGQCAHACPQHIDVPAALEELARLFETTPKWTETAKSRHDSIRRDLHM